MRADSLEVLKQREIGKKFSSTQKEQLKAINRRKVRNLKAQRRDFNTIVDQVFANVVKRS
jgi:hypothetical protein